MSDWSEFGRRRQAKDGIRARSQRGGIGETWWSRRFLEALEGVAADSRLSRGRSYARSGQVMDLKVEPGVVTARVQGSQPRPYGVRIALKPFTGAEWARVEEALAAEALFLAALLAGEMPRDVERAFAAAGLSLFPAKPGDLSTGCSCPDWANPCKHVAATYYILAEAFDADPFLALAWRGRPRDALLERLRELRGAVPDAPSAESVPPPPPEPRTGGFWRAGPELASLRFDPHAAEIPDAVLRQLGPLPAEAGGEGVAGALAAAYRAFTAAAGRRAFGEDGDREDVDDDADPADPSPPDG
jgi:uncharacterized Zn finger protein